MVPMDTLADTLTDTLALAGGDASMIDRFGVYFGILIGLILLVLGIRHFRKRRVYYNPSNGGTGGGTVDPRPRPDPRNPQERT